MNFMLSYFMPCGPCITGFLWRHEHRARYGIETNYVHDVCCTLMCCGCLLDCQDAREVKRRTNAYSIIHVDAPEAMQMK
eukprot:tig00000769_g4020.t1